MATGQRDDSAKNRFLQFLEENNGDFSATRLGFLLWIVGALIVWVIVSLTEGKIQNIPNDVAAIIGILMTGKVVQKFGEKPSDVKSPQ